MTWSNPPSNFKKAVRGDLNSATKRVGLKILRTLTVESPVDTGRFKGNWVVGVNARDTRQLDYKDKAGGPTFAKGQKKINSKNPGQKLFISNNLPYAQALNDGHSDQAPANFVQSAIRRALK